MSEVQDFQARARSHTAGTEKSRSVPINVLPAGIAHRARTFSGDSHVSAASYVNGAPRTKHLSRSNTVTTYRIPHMKEETLQPGAEPGIDPTLDDEKLPAAVRNLKARCQINVIDYSGDPDVPPRHLHANNDDVAVVLEEPRPAEYTCRWICVNGLSWDVIKSLSNMFHLHQLAIEDMAHTHTRTKVDWYTDHACIVLTLQKLVRLHWHDDSDEGCDCMDATDNADPASEKLGNPMSTPQLAKMKRKKSWWQKWFRPRSQRKSQLPYHVDVDDDGKIDEFVNAHTGISEDTPIRAVRTLHRYESAQIPEHTAFMEKHSTLSPEDLAVSVEQVSIFLLGYNTVISFFEQSAEDIERPLLERINSTETMLRRGADASLLLQAIIDAIVDLATPIRDAYNQARKELQVDAMVNPNIATSRALHIFGEEIDMLQNLIKPIVHLVGAIRDHNSDAPAGSPPAPVSPLAEEGSRTDEHKPNRDSPATFNRSVTGYKRPTPLRRKTAASSVTISPLAHTYFGDVQDHCISLIQALEQMDASASNISTLIFNTVGARTNNFMMILAVVTVFFAPLTFISGYFGQNFSNGDGLDHPFAFFWIVSLPVLIVFMGLVFGFMLWDNIRDWFSKRGIRAHRSRRNKDRRTKGHYG